MIEVGEYVRTKNGYIAKAKDIICKGYPVKKLEGYVVCDDEDRTIIDPKEVKHSKNIIDLIEVGDYLNGIQVYSEEGKLAVEVAEHMPPYKLIEDMEIKTILTKEQYQSNCYTVERNE